MSLSLEYTSQRRSRCTSMLPVWARGSQRHMGMSRGQGPLQAGWRQASWRRRRRMVGP